jgi:hypothetical protein
MNFIARNARPLFYASWFLLGLLQAAFTELQDDEAYYWVYARYLDWGYFDHPPLTAVLIRAGGFLSDSELGVRIFPLILNTATIAITESLLQQKNRILFYAICLSLAAIQITGYWAVPDVPLLFFTAVFFWCYRRFIKQMHAGNTVLLSVAAALLLYTKYHGVLVLFFTLLSNLSLFRRPQTYLAGLLALLLFTPHLWWQYQHGWISFRYHLFESNVNPYKISYTTEYILGQLLIAGPLAGPILLAATFSYKTKNAVERALQFTGVGILVFFLLTTFKGKVEANWTAPVMIPMLVLTHQFLLRRHGMRRWLYRLLPVTILLVLAVRVIMIADIVPAKAVVQRFHAWKDWPEALRKKTGGSPLVFNNSYQRASKTWFYTGQPTYSLNHYRERRNNYNFWPIEDSMLGRPVYILDIYNLETFDDSLQAKLWKIGMNKDSSFRSFARIMLRSKRVPGNMKAGETILLQLQVSMPDHYRAYLQQHPEVNYPVKVGVFQNRDWVQDIETPLRLQDLWKQEQVSVPIRLPAGDYFLRVAIGTSTTVFTHNSDKINLQVR